MTTNCADRTADERNFRWLNFGSCMMRIAFDTPEFFRQEFQGLPIAVSKIWRRQLSAIMNDWDVMPELSAELPESQFRDAWPSTGQICLKVRQISDRTKQPPLINGSITI